MTARLVSVFLLIALVAVLAPPLDLVPHLAEAKCTSGTGRPNNWPHHYHVGSIRTGSAGGVYSRIKNYSPWVYPIASDKSTAFGWAMLYDSAVTGRWAQVGWREKPYGVRRTYVEYIDSSNSVWQLPNWSAKPINSYTYYTVLYNNPAGKISFQVDGVTIHSFNISFAPSQAQLASETHSFADQMLGGYSGSAYRADYFDSHVYLNGSWQAFAGNIPLERRL
jgi:hypothetical protein